MPASKRKPAVQAVLPDLNRSVRTAAWIGPEDAGAVRLARKLAAEVDRTESARVVASLANALQRSLSSLGLTPESRPEGTLEDAYDPVVHLRAVVEARRNASALLDGDGP